MRLAVVLACLCLAACGRPMTSAEENMARVVFGPTLDTSKITVAQGAGIFPASKTRVTRTRLVRGTDKACIRTPQPPSDAPAPAFAFRNKVRFNSGLYSDDMATEWPKRLRFPHALIFAHELTHVWQWQNRKRTGYTPFRAAMESLRLVDPYYAPPGEAAFLSFGYEQQAAIVEDYLCFAFANPTHPRRAELRAILEPVFPVDRIDAVIGR